jgi:hypothetical protein
MKPGLSPLLRFHLSVGARLAMRVLAPAIAAAVGGLILLGVDFLDSFAAELFGSARRHGSGLPIAAACFAVGWMAAPRVCRGLGGWMRHLPVSGVAQRRAAMLAIAFAQLPLALLLAFLAASALVQGGRPVPALLGLLAAAPAAALVAMPVARPLLARPLALAGGVLAVAGGWLPLAAGAALVLAADLVAGPLGSERKTARTSHPWTAERGIEARIAWRALGWRLPGALGSALLPLAAGWLFLHNNDLSPAHRALGARLAGGAACVFLLSSLAESLAVLRPAWPWARSLPRSADQRARFDALFLGAHALPAALATAALDPLSALPVLALLPWIAARAAGAMRRAPERLTGASGEILGEGLLLVAAVALLPWVALLPLLALPLALRFAAERDRRQKVSRWMEIHHLAAGDPQSWSSG